MKPLAPATNIARTRSGDDVHHRTSDSPPSHRKARAKRLKKSSTT